MSTSLADWFATPLGQYLLAREQAYFDQTVADIFGFHALQIGLPEAPFLAQSRIPQRWTLDYDPPADVIADPHWLPFAENSIDLIVLPHALEFTDDPHLMLREAYRVIRPEGQIVIAGFNPFSLFGAKRYFGRGADAAVERQLHRALPVEGLAGAARLRRRRRPPRRATCRRSRSEKWLQRFGVLRAAPATAGGRSPAASTSCARPSSVLGMRVHHAGVAAPRAARTRSRPRRAAREGLTDAAARRDR